MKLNYIKSSKFLSYISYKPVGLEDVLSLRKAEQVHCDCYLVSSMEALSRSKNGKKIISDNIQNYKSIYKCTFRDLKGKPKDYYITQENINNSRHAYKQKNPLLKVLNIAMERLVQRYSNKKDVLSWIIAPDQFTFEYNRPSRFMTMFTGKKPINIAESSFNLNLKSRKKEVLELFEKMGKTPGNDYSFVAGTGFRSITDTGGTWHCFTITKVDLKNKVIHAKNKRTNYINKLDFDTALKKFKFIVGYFNENLK